MILDFFLAFLGSRIAIFEEAVVPCGFSLRTGAAADDPMSTTKSNFEAIPAYGLRPSGFKGFCVGSVGSYRFSTAGVEEEPDHQEEI